MSDERTPCDVSCDIPNKETLEAIEEVRRMNADPTLGKTYKISSPDDVHNMIEDMLQDQ